MIAVATIFGNLVLVMACTKIKITKFKNRGGTFSWRVAATVDGQRYRKNFADKNEAMEEKQHLEIKQASGGAFRTAVTTLSDFQLAEAQHGFDRIADRASLREVVDFYLKNYREPTCEFCVEEVLEDFYKAKRAAGVRERSITQLTSTLSRFGKTVNGTFLHDISTETLQSYIAKHEWSRKTQNNVRADLHSFFEWCRAKPRQWIYENPARDLPKFKLERGIPNILDVKTAKALMAHVATEDEGALAPFFALALFAGIRPAHPTGELGKIAAKGEGAWELIDLANKVIRIPPEISKTEEYRTINIQPNLAAWLKPYAKKKASIVGKDFDDDYKAARKKFNLGHDVLRHSFISYHVAKFESIGGTALQSGNSEAIVRRHYLKMVSKKEANQFWSIRPPR